MSHRFSERGNSAINLILSLIVLSAVGMGLAQFLPAQQRRAALYDFMVDQTQTSARVPAKTVERRVFEKARELKVPLTKEDIKVMKNNRQVRIQCSYVEPLNFIIYTHNWKIDLKVDRAVYIF